jgi:hypothetical protein
MPYNAVDLLVSILHDPGDEAGTACAADEGTPAAELRDVCYADPCYDVIWGRRDLTITGAHNLWGASWGSPEGLLTDKTAEWLEQFEGTPLASTCNSSYVEARCVAKAEKMCELVFNTTLIDGQQEMEVGGVTAALVACTLPAICILPLLAAVVARLRGEGGGGGGGEKRTKRRAILAAMGSSEAEDAASEVRIGWMTLDFDNRDLEDKYRKIETLENRVQLRYLIIMGLVVIIGYQMFLWNSRIEMQWEMVSSGNVRHSGMMRH